MERCLVFFIIGSLLSLFLPIVPPLFYLFCLFVVAVIFFFVTWLRKFSPLIIGFTYLLCHASLHFSWAEQNNLAINQIHQQPVWVTGKVQTLVTNNQQTIRFNLMVDIIGGDDLTDPFSIRLSWKQPEVVISQGDVIRLLVKIKPAHGFANVGSFSYQRWLLQHRIAMTGYVKNHGNNQIVNQGITLRQFLYNRLSKLLESPHKGLVMALALGDKSAISKDQWQILQATGTQHLMAISGLHLGLIAGFALFFARIGSYLLPKASLPERHLFIIPLIFCLAFAGFYAYLAGFSTPTVRALVMLVVFWGLRCLHSKISIIRWLLVTMVIIVLLDPFALLDSSFYLSLAAVTSILFIGWRFQYLIRNKSKVSRFLLSLLFVQFAISLFVMPITVMLFGQVSLLSPVANFVVVPFLSFTAIPLILLALITTFNFPEFSLLVMQIALWCLDIAWQFLSLLGSCEQCLVMPDRTGLFFAITLPVLLLLVILSPGRFKKLLLAYGVLLVSISAGWWVGNYQQRHNNHWQVVVFDVGHGLAVMIIKNNQAILYDTGAAFSSGFNMAEAVIHPYLKHRFIEQFEQVIVSHSDNDHAGGLGYLQQNNLSKQYRLNFANNHQPLVCTAGQQFIWQELTFKFVWPNKVQGKANDDSCVLHISDNVNSLLLPGDISKKIEKQLVKQQQLSAVSLLIAAHHGSKSSSSTNFVQMLKPKHVVFSSGYLNRWQMPVDSVQARFKQISSRQYNTAEQGMLLFDFSPQGVKARSFNDDLLPFWPWKPISQQK